MMRVGICLAGHGAPPLDFPPHRLRALFAGHDHGAEPGGSREALEFEVRAWPRTAANDPYKTGLEAVARELRALGNPLVEVAFNEFCDPTIESAIGTLIEQGADSVIVVSSMLTAGGRHSEDDIAAAAERAGRAHAPIPVTYAWPYAARDFAAFLHEQARRFAVMPSNRRSFSAPQDAPLK